VEHSTRRGAENVDDRRMNHETLSGITPEKSNSGEVSACATVAFVAETQLGADRGALWLTVISEVSVPRFFDDSQPAGRTGGEAESKFSVYGKTVTWAAAGPTRRRMPGTAGRKRNIRKRGITPREPCLTFWAIISIYALYNTTRDHGPVTSSLC
jgi:hypothetical protein